MTEQRASRMVGGMLGLPGLRVLLVLGPSDGGIGRHVRSLADGLVRRGAAVTVAGPAVTDTVFGFGTTGAAFVPLTSAPALRRVARGADVVHAHGLRAGSLAALAVRRPVPLVITWHNAVLAQGAARRAYAVLERLGAHRADVLLAASADLAARGRQVGGRDVRPGPVAAPALPFPARGAAEVRAELGATGRPLVLAVGRLHRQKGLDTLVQAAALLSHREPAPLVAIAGDGPLRAELEQQVARLSAPVRLLGRRDDVADLLHAADIAALPSRWEARALVAQEALRVGVPLVTTAVGGLPELVGSAATLVPPDEPGALAAALSALLDDPSSAAAQAARGRARAAGWPDEADTIAAVAAVYAELTGWAP